MSRVVITRESTFWRVAIMKKDITDKLISVEMAKEPTLRQAEELKKFLDDCFLINQMSQARRAIL